MNSDHERAVEYAEKAGRLSYRVELLTAVLRDVRSHPSVNALIVDEACRRRGLAVDWSAAQHEQEGSL